MALELSPKLAQSISEKHVPNSVTPDSKRSTFGGAVHLWRVLVRLAVAGLCLLFLAAADSNSPAVAPAALATASSVSSCTSSSNDG